MIVNDDPDSLAIGKELNAPVVKGMLDRIEGTTLHYFRDENFPVRTIALSFEAGQHDEPLSVNRTIACIINCLRTIGCVRAADVENRHNELLVEFSKNLPKVTRLISSYNIEDQSKFRLLPGFNNFQKIKKGQLIGYDLQGEILASEDSLILMPRYQSQGDDGFFLIKEVA
jgi:succinylglutamate desuccinylase